MRTALAAVLTTMFLAGAIGCTDAEVIEGRPAGPPKFALRVNCAATKEYTDAGGAKWLGDQVLTGEAKWGAMDGLTVDRGAIKIEGTEMPDLYRTERYSMKGYQFAVANGTYTVRLHFAETYSGITAAGGRVFSVNVQGEVKLKDLDVLKEAGGFAKALVKECKGVAVTDGKLTIEFVANVQNPEINAIEVLRY